MKKFIIIALILLCTGCYDYNELNDLEIVSSMIVDYEEGNYIVNIEVLDTSESASKGSYFLKGEGKSLEEAMNNVYFGSASTPFYAHMKSLILSDTVAQRGIDEFFDYLLRDTKLRKDFFVFVSDNVDDILEFETEPKESIGEMARMSARRNLEGNGRYRTCTFREMIFNYMRNNYYMLGSISIEDEIINLEDTYLFIDNKMSFKVDDNAVLFANMMADDSEKFQIFGDYTYEMHGFKLEKEVKKDKIIISLKGHARLLDADKNDSLDDKSLKRLEDELNKVLENAGMEIVDYAKRLDHDMFNFNYCYYLYFPKLVNDDTWKTLEYEFHSDLTLSEKGLLLNTLGGSKDGE